MSMRQNLIADRAALLFLSERMNRVKRHAANELPLDQILPTILSQPTVAFHLLPMAGTSTPKAANSAKPQSPEKRSRSANGQSQTKGRGKSKVQQGAQCTNCIDRQKALETPQKKRLCWSFNLPNGCNATGRSLFQRLTPLRRTRVL